MPTQQTPQRQLPPARMEIPQCQINSRDRLCEGPGFTGLQRQYVGALRERLEDLRGAVKLASDDGRREHLVDEPGTMLGARRGKVAPGLTPPLDAVFVDGANEDGRTVQHLTKRGDHRRRQGIAVAERLDGAER